MFKFNDISGDMRDINTCNMYWLNSLTALILNFWGWKMYRAIWWICVYKAHHFILLRLNPFDLNVDREGMWFEHSVSELRVCLSTEGAKNVSWSWLSLLRGWCSLTMEFTGRFVYIKLTISSCYDSVSLTLVLIERYDGLSTLCHSCGLVVSKGCLKSFLALAISAPWMG